MVINYARHRAAIERLYEGVCDIYGYTSSINPDNGENELEEVLLYVAQPCRLSYETQRNQAQQTNTGAIIDQQIKLFISPELVIPPGCKIIVTQNCMPATYKNSGQPAKYGSHQEISLELWEEYA
ncbi:MAG: hypothetical protein FWF85_02465 [Clostridiales bacterium]|nr:hypothetical protein [Clostridiales bacterium]